MELEIKSIAVRRLTEEDTNHLREAISIDVWHTGQLPEDWIEAREKILTFFDEEGPIFHMGWELEPEKTVRVFCQFDLRVNKARVARALLLAFDMTVEQAKSNGIKRIVFKSESPKLIAFLERQGFTSAGNGDYEFKVGE